MLADAAVAVPGGLRHSGPLAKSTAWAEQAPWLVLGRRDGAVRGVWILAPGLGQLMVHQGRLEGRGWWEARSGCGCWTVPRWRQGSMGSAVGTASLGHPAQRMASVLGTCWGWTLPHASLLQQLGKTRILCGPEHRRAQERSWPLGSWARCGMCRCTLLWCCTQAHGHV